MLEVGTFDSCREPSYEPRQTEEASREEEEMTIEQARALGAQSGHDATKFTPAQLRAMYRVFLSTCMRALDMKSPRHYPYYEESLQPHSVPEDAWPCEIAFRKAEYLKRSYVDPDDLAARLQKLKPSDNFELQKYPHPYVVWKDSPLEEAAYNMQPAQPKWVSDLQDLACDAIGELGEAKAECIIEEADRLWDAIVCNIRMWPPPDLHLRNQFGSSPGGTLYPWYLVKGLGALCRQGNHMSAKCYKEEYKVAETERETAIRRWKERNPEVTLSHDVRSLYISWPAELMDELAKIDQESLQRGMRRHCDVLRETERKMSDLVTFWEDCGSITGRRDPPSSIGYPDPMAKVRGLKMPMYLKERVSAIEAETGTSADRIAMRRVIEVSRWKEAVLSGETETSAAEGPLPEALLSELDALWPGHGMNWMDMEDVEDVMIAKIRQWRKASYKQCSQTQLSCDTASGEEVAGANDPPTTLTTEKRKSPSEIGSSCTKRRAGIETMPHARHRGITKRCGRNPTTEVMWPTSAARTR